MSQLQDAQARIDVLEKALQAIADEALQHHEHNLADGVDRLPQGYTHILNIASEAITETQSP